MCLKMGDWPPISDTYNSIWKIMINHGILEYPIFIKCRGRNDHHSPTFRGALGGRLRRSRLIYSYPPVNEEFANWKMDENGPCIIDLPIKSGDFPYVRLPEGSFKTVF